MAVLEGAQIQDLFREKFTEKRKILLVKALNFPEYDEEDDLKSAIVLDVYYEALSFAVNQGLPWNQVAVFFQIIQKTLKNIADIDQTLPNAIQHFEQDIGDCACLYTESSLKSLVDYVFMTLFQHYKLHRYVLTRERVEDRTKCTMLIEPPPELPPLSDAMPKTEWDEKQKLKKIDEMEERQKLERHTHYQQLLEEATKHLDIPFEELTVSEQQVNKDTLTSIVKDVASAQANVTETLLQETMDEIKDTLEFQHMRANVMAEYENFDTKAARRKSNTPSGKAKKK